MKTTTPQTIFLTDYKPPAYLVSEIKLVFSLDDQHTHVASKMHFYIHPNATAEAPALVLNGEKMKLLSVKLDGRQLSPEEYALDEHTLTIKHPPKAFCLEIENEINPQANTALDGLYKSGHIFCTQNEPEGFRKITYFLDRSDIMAEYTTKIIADQKSYPVLLSNGNEVGRGSLPDGKHWVEWHDPFAKPSYLFALVAGDLGCIQDHYLTQSGRKVDLRIYCDKGNESKCHHAMSSLKKSMQWDEQVYQLEYDLDIFMIVAVDAFNMGAMENKGLNIFNTSCVLADPASATDANYARVEKVIAHEYFHNWTGNRITCRDWFQLTLKEGLTVFRDQEFTSDIHSRALHRIENVIILRASQFPEDAGPTAHSIKPNSYVQINNFYTPTVYNKGSEVIRMIQTLIGRESFFKGMKKYFELFDGQAVTTEDFVYAMEQASGKDLTQFKRWYSQAGTPEIQVNTEYDGAHKTFTLNIKQSCAATADHSPKEPFHFPLELGLIGKDGKDLPLKLNGHPLSQSVIEITQAEENFIFEEIDEAPILSINRNFSAPIKVHVNYTRQDNIFLMAHDSDPFNRWEAGQKLATDLILSMAADLSEGKTIELDKGYIKAFGMLLDDPALDNGFKAYALMLPSEATLAQEQEIIDFDGIHLAREFMRYELANAYQGRFKQIYDCLHTQEPYDFNAEAVGKRSLKDVCLAYLACLEAKEAIELCSKQFNQAAHMNDQFAALSILANVACPQRELALKAFYDQWKNDTLVMNKWLAVQAGSKLDGTFENVHALMKDPIFDVKIPNLVRALLLTFANNLVHFHRNDGAGYEFIADRIMEIDRLNPQMAASLAKSYHHYAQLDPRRKKAMKRALDRLLAAPGLSSNAYEIVSKSLASA